MVNKVNGNTYYTYNRQKSINVSDTGEQFSLDYKQGEMPTKTKEDKDKETEEDGVRLELSGNGQTSSKTGQPAVQKASAVKTPAAEKQPTLLNTLQEVLTSLFSAIRSFFSKLWNEPESAADAKEDSDTTVNAEENAALTETIQAEESVPSAESLLTETLPETEASELTAFIPDAQAADSELAEEDAETAYRMSRERLEEEIRPYLRNKDMAQVISILTDNGNRMVAKNSTLLTYYDKRGRITEPNASDRERILYGDKNARNL